mmetsp:Transcript_56000/g.135491  ORF Transcript_56000/g.135491 Transcript_56000/m.135491 type:complete len:103 (-) Transcript_56000:5277-5585(-)
MVKSSPTTLFPDAATASSRVPTKQEENACRDNKSKSTSENNEIGGTIRSLKKLLVRGGGGGGSSGGRDGKSTTAATTTTSDKKTMMMIDKQSEHTATETTMV